MKKTKVLFLALLALMSFGAFAQNPVLSWRFNNAQVITGDTLQFDIELKCSLAGTYHSSTQIYFRYNTQAFGSNIVANNKIKFERLALLAGQTAGQDKYKVNNQADNNDSTYAILFEASFIIANPTFMNEVTLDYQGFGRFKIKIADMGENAGIYMLPDYFGVGMMNGGQYYVDATHPAETKYGDPPLYAGIYENDLINYMFSQPGWINGTVTDAVTTNPIAGATVTAGSFSTTTLGDGTYNLEVSAGTYDVTASAPCYAPMTASGIVVAEGATVTQDFALTGNPNGTISGTVTDAITLNPIENVTVTAGAYSTATLADGTYTIDNVTPGTYDVVFTHANYFNFTVNGVIVVCGVTSTVNAQMTPTATSGTIAGIVTDAVTTLPLADATVTAGSYSTMTAADGTYSLVVPAATYDVTASKTCYETKTQTAIVVTGLTTTLDFALTPLSWGTLQGYVTDDVTTQGIAGATVVAGAYNTTTDANGWYTMQAWEGTYDVTASHPDYTSGTVNGVVVMCGQTTTQNIALHPNNPPNPVLSWQFSNYSFDADSVYFDIELKCSFPGTYHSSTQIYFDYNPQTFGENIMYNNKISFSRLALLAGEISPGNPKYEIVNAVDNTPSRFAIIFEAPVVLPNPAFMNEVTMNFQGFMHFAIKITNPLTQPNICFTATVPPGIGLMDGGQYYVDAYHPEETKYGNPPNYAGFYGDCITQIPYPTGTLTGIVTNQYTSEPIADVTITATSAGNTFTTMTNSAGLYTIGLPAGTYSVTASKNCFISQTVNNVVITASGTTFQNFELVPDPYGTITGTVTDATSGQPVANVNVVTNPGGYTATTTTAGVYTMNNVPEGVYELTFTKTGYNTLTIPNVTVVCGQTTTQNAQMTQTTGTITGTVTDMVSGNPIVGASVQAGSAPAVLTNASGVYTITIAPGTYTVTATATGYVSASTPGVVVTAGQTTTVNFELEPVLPPTNVQATVANCNDVTVTWQAPGGGGGGDILLVDRDGSTSGDYTDCSPMFKQALEDNGITDYGYYEVTDLTLNGPDLATMQQYDIIIWWSGEAWGYYGDDCMTPTDEQNVGQFLQGGGRFLMSAMDYLYASYPNAGTLTAGTFPYDYLGLRTVSQDVWSIQTPATATVQGVTGSCAQGFTFNVQDIFTAKEGLYIDQITQTAGQNLFNITTPTPTGICATQYAGTNFKSIFTTADFAAITDQTIRKDLMMAMLNWLGSAEGGKAPSSYNVYRDGTLLGNTTQLTYSDPDAPTGTHTYCVKSVYTGGIESTQACATPVTTENCLPPTTLNGTVSGSNINLTWQAPGGGTWIHWDDGANASAIGLTNGGTFYCASHWLPADLTQYAGQYINKIKFFFYEDPTSTFVVYVWKGANAGTQLLMQNVSNPVVGDWNEVTLTTPVQIDATAELWFGYKVTHGASTFPAGTDVGPAVANKGDMISLNGTTWESMSISYSLNYNWNLQAYVSPVDGGLTPAQPMVKTMEPIVNTGTLAVKPNFMPKSVSNVESLLGYNVYRAVNPNTTFTKINTNIVTVTNYTDASVPNGGYKYHVKAVYTSGESAPSNEVGWLWVGIVDNTLTTSLVVYPNPATDLVNIKSEVGIEEVIITSMTGSLVEKMMVSGENLLQINTNSLQSGIYNVQIRTEKGVVNTKLVVK